MTSTDWNFLDAVPAARFACIVLILFLSSFASAARAAGGDEAAGRYIVVLKDSVDRVGSVARAQIEQGDGDLGFIYTHALNGYSAELSRSVVAALRQDPHVKYVTRDHRVEALAQAVPTGIRRAFASENAAIGIDEVDKRVDVDVAVIDSGIDYTHDDLNVVARTYCNGVEASATCTDNTGTDNLGHGTHVAGTVAALDNGEGVVGVAPGARLWAVKVLDPVAWESEVLAGVNWVTARASQIEVANMSLGCSCSQPALEEAIEKSVKAGIVYVVSAGNSATDVKNASPAKNPYAITVSALADFDGEPGAKSGSSECREAYESFEGPQKDDSLAVFSNRGKGVEVAAPGTCIRSTAPGDNYVEMSGTSMAAPHVTGAAAILASKSNPGSLTDVEKIRNTIMEEGNLEWEDPSGDGEHEPLLDVTDGAVFKPKLTALPSVNTLYASEIHPNSANLQGNVDPNNLPTTYQFEYGETTSYGSKAPASPKSVGSGDESQVVTYLAEGLQPGATYHFRVVASNEIGTAYGVDKTFLIPLAPKVQFADNSGEPLAAGASINAKASTFNYYASGGSHWCTEGPSFTGEVTSNGSDPATAGMLTGQPAAHCSLAGLLQKMLRFDLPGEVELSPYGTGSIPIEFEIEDNYYYQATCLASATFPLTWDYEVPGGATNFWINGTAPLEVVGEPEWGGCPTEVTLEANVNLTDKSGKPVKVAMIP